MGYAQKLSYAQKLRRKRFNYSTSVDDEHLKEATVTVARSVGSRAKQLSRRESVGEFYQGKQSGELDLGVRRGALEAGRRRSCIESSLEDDYEIKLVKDDQIVKPIKDLDRKPGNKSEKLDNKLTRQTNERAVHEATRNELNSKSNEKSNERLVNHFKEDKDSLMLESELSEFSSLSMLANVSKLESTSSSLSTSTMSTNEESKFLNQPDEKPGPNLKRKIRRINFRQQSIDNQDNCLLM